MCMSLRSFILTGHTPRIPLIEGVIDLFDSIGLAFYPKILNKRLYAPTPVTTTANVY